MSSSPLELFARFMPHGQCVRWEPLVLGPQLVGDFMTWTAYLAIPFALVHFIRANTSGVLLMSGRRAVALYWWFAVFIFLCGTTHLMGIITVWHGVYVLDAVVKIATGIVSWITVDRLWRTNVEQQVLWQSPEHLERVRTAILLAEQGLAKIERALTKNVPNAV